MTDLGQPLPIAANLEEVRARIAAAAQAADRSPDGVTLIAVAKSQPLERVQAALAAGQRVFGENYVQEAQSRWSPLREIWAGLELHLIGGLQTNKAADAVALFDVIQTLDRPKLARAMAKEMDRQGRRPRLLVQVNTGEEPQKSGVVPADLPAFMRLCRAELGLQIAGLMAIPPEDEDVALHTALLAKLAAREGVAGLSIGMSGDYEAAIRFGATYVRVGTAIFGSRVRPRG
ncbi:MAG: YggS family pyridoxal phosphate-dependent enzyme [Geminicoccaceae bacterium]